MKEILPYYIAEVDKKASEYLIKNAAKTGYKPL